MNYYTASIKKVSHSRFAILIYSSLLFDIIISLVLFILLYFVLLFSVYKYYRYYLFFKLNYKKAFASNLIYILFSFPSLGSSFPLL